MTFRKPQLYSHPDEWLLLKLVIQVYNLSANSEPNSPGDEKAENKQTSRENK